MDYDISGGDSECSSGCESGWTVYFENSYVAPPHHHSCPDDDDDDGNGFLPMKSGFCRENPYEEEEEEEDLSMVSDASSGPPHFAEEDDCGNYGCSYSHGGNYGRHINAPLPSTLPFPPNNSNAKVQRSRENRRHRKSIGGFGAEEQASALDDTASSPFFNFMNNNYAIKGQVENGVLDFSQGYSTNNFVYQQQYGFYHPSQIQGNQWYEGKKWE